MHVLAAPMDGDLDSLPPTVRKKVCTVHPACFFSSKHHSQMPHVLQIFVASLVWRDRLGCGRFRIRASDTTFFSLKTGVFILPNRSMLPDHMILTALMPQCHYWPMATRTGPSCSGELRKGQPWGVLDSDLQSGWALAAPKVPPSDRLLALRNASIDAPFKALMQGLAVMRLPLTAVTTPASM